MKHQWTTDAEAVKNERHANRYKHAIRFEVNEKWYARTRSKNIIVREISKRLK